MVAIEGGTQALRRTINARLQIAAGLATTVSVPSPFGAVIKAAAYQTDSRDRERHLRDAALLLAVIEDPYLERDQLAGSDRSRLQMLAGATGLCCTMANAAGRCPGSRTNRAADPECLTSRQYRLSWLSFVDTLRRLDPD